MADKALRISIAGRVQGVGFRPFVSRLAHRLGLAGWVRNSSGQVEIHAEGNEQALKIFVADLMQKAPPLAQPESLTSELVATQALVGFTILDSSADSVADNHIPPDYFVCNDCLAEMLDPGERRYRYPFINCTQCGPRYTIIDRLPYDRPNTAMAGFALCEDCRAEYDAPTDRRHHAQPLACPACGPALTFRRLGYADLAGNEKALAACIDGLRLGWVIAVKGVGGYHLLCDAGQVDAVERLRQRKQRPDKPLALLLPWSGESGLEAVQQLAELEPAEAERLRSPLRPIVLVKKRDGAPLAENIAPGLNEVGLMLPYSPLHYLLADGFGGPLVATSANISGEPVLTDAEEVALRLASVADAFLDHDRPIRRPADDSVYRLIAGKTRPLRLGRGGAPLEYKVAFRFEQPLLAVGADLKNTVALGFDDRIVVSPHIGNMGSPRSQQVFEQVLADLQVLYGVTASRVVCDAHPGYHTRQWALRSGLPLSEVFHHHAHASALVGEHRIDDPCLVFTWDGTGYGEDGSIWGGETLLGGPGDWRRVASLKPFHLPGGDKASRQGWRSALALCWEIDEDWPDCHQDSAMLRTAWEKKINCPASSSTGRLFDAAAALIGIADQSSYEGHAAMLLEACGRQTGQQISLPASWNGELLISDWSPLIAYLKQRDIRQSERSSVFHASLAAAIVEQAIALRERTAVSRVGLTGGVFQNRLLTEQAKSGLLDNGFTVYLHEQLPAGDGGISFGQLIEAGCSRP